VGTEPDESILDWRRSKAAPGRGHGWCLQGCLRTWHSSTKWTCVRLLTWSPSSGFTRHESKRLGV